MSELFYKFPKGSDTTEKLKKAREFESVFYKKWDVFREKHGIETSKVGMYEDRLVFVPTEEDSKNFKDQFLAKSYGNNVQQFRVKSKIGKAWVEHMADVEFHVEPSIAWLLKNLLGKTKTSGFFDKDAEVAYYVINTEHDRTHEDLGFPDGAIAIKGSEYYSEYERLMGDQ